jgi:hypothetical protein
MSPVEAAFLAMFIIFGAVGVVRGYARELGVTTMLLIALFLLEIIDERYIAVFNQVLTWAGVPATAQSEAKTAIFCGFLILIAFISYQGETLTFPGRGTSNPISLGTGLINGYFFAGSLWYYLDKAGWPWLRVDTQHFTDFYRLVVKLLPPAIFRWEYLIALAVFMLIMRVWK